MRENEGWTCCSCSKAARCYYGLPLPRTSVCHDTSDLEHNREEGEHKVPRTDTSLIDLN